ncbi:hypothetical protein OMCYN_01678 [cyanobiont of Ornithocercus magnificus]|nr:hypothetical protein OMCYN_01678 [cyanobiont of Ornithocercus magnificus]
MFVSVPDNCLPKALLVGETAVYKSWPHDTIKKIKIWMKLHGGKCEYCVDERGDQALRIQTPTGPQLVKPNDYIIRNSRNEFFACTATVFGMTYGLDVPYWG